MEQATQALDKAGLDSVLKGFNIPAQPRVMIDIQEERAKAEPSLPKIAKIIAQDVGLSGAVLKTINSPFFGMRRKIDSIQQAVMLLGMNNVVNLVTGYALRSSIQGKCSISLERFWDSASDVAEISMAIAKRINLSVSPDEAYMLGLFIDCGIPVLASKYDNYKEILIEANADHEHDITEIEDYNYGTNHAVIGYYTSRSWGLPEALRQAILAHHDIDKLFAESADDTQFKRDKLVAILKMAEDISHTFRRLSENVEWMQIQDTVLEYLNVNELEYLELKDDIHQMLNDR